MPEKRERSIGQLSFVVADSSDVVAGGVVAGNVAAVGGGVAGSVAAVGGGVAAVGGVAGCPVLVAGPVEGCWTSVTLDSGTSV
jgi:hypothetical protein